MAILIFIFGAIWYLLAIALWFYIVYHQSKSVIEYDNDIQALKENIVKIQKEISSRSLSSTEVKSLVAFISRLERFIDHNTHT